MKYDKIISFGNGVYKVRYGVLFGNGNIVFVKAGAGGTVRGQADKHLKMAHLIHESMGATVICASNPDIYHVDCDEYAIRRIDAKQGHIIKKLIFIGTSDGAYHNLILAPRFSESHKLLLINASYKTLSDLKERLRELPSLEKIFVYGTEDEEFSEIFPVLKEMGADKLRSVIVRGADHSFTDMTQEYIDLASLVVEPNK